MDARRADVRRAGSGRRERGSAGYGDGFLHGGYGYGYGYGGYGSYGAAIYDARPVPEGANPGYVVVPGIRQSPVLPPAIYVIGESRRGATPPDGKAARNRPATARLSGSRGR